MKMINWILNTIMGAFAGVFIGHSYYHKANYPAEIKTAVNSCC